MESHILANVATRIARHTTLAISARVSRARARAGRGFDLDEARVHLLAQSLNRTHGADDPKA